MKLCIFGSRSISPSPTEIDDALLSAIEKEIFPQSAIGITEVVSGMAKGADLAAIAWARTVKLPVVQMPANWKEYGRAAGFIRNGQMADFADLFIGFWDGESRGTAQMMRCVAIRKKPLHMVVRRKIEYIDQDDMELDFEVYGDWRPSKNV
jgi:hypothetical protein